MALCLKEDRDFTVEDGGRRERGFLLLQNKKMLFSCLRLSFFYQNCQEEAAGSGLPELGAGCLPGLCVWVVG